jgi:hypothetical protein
MIFCVTSYIFHKRRVIFKSPLRFQARLLWSLNFAASPSYGATTSGIEDTSFFELQIFFWILVFLFSWFLHQFSKLKNHKIVNFSFLRKISQYISIILKRSDFRPLMWPKLSFKILFQEFKRMHYSSFHPLLDKSEWITSSGKNFQSRRNHYRRFWISSLHWKKMPGSFNKVLNLELKAQCKLDQLNLF